MISVIIPLYNKEAIIKRTLRSVLSQDYDDYEVVIVDDGSTDRSLEICKHELPRICHELSKNINIVSIIQQENGGPSKARNTGVRRAKGEWLYFLDADDEMEYGVLKHFSGLINEYSEADMFVGEVSFFDGKIKIIAKQYKDGFLKNIFKQYFLGNIFQCSGSSLYKRSVCEHFMYNEQIRRYEDLECLFRRYRECTLYLTHYRVSIINTKFAEASHGRKDIEEDFLGHIDFNGKSFWEKMCLYQFYLGERPLYKEQCNKMYHMLRWRYDLLLLNKILKFIWH